MSTSSCLKEFIHRVLSANGPAQIVSYSFWGVLMAGMLWGASCVPKTILLIWGAVSLVVLISAIWFSKRATINLLWLDMFLSATVLAMYIMYTPEYVSIMVYNVKADGAFDKLELDVTQWFTDAMLIWMTLHSAYLANLFQRQELESRRFRNGL